MTTRLYRAIALAFVMAFLVTGLAFLVHPHGVQARLDQAALLTPGLPAGRVDSGLFRALAVAYMYLVTLLAWRMFRRPTEAVWPTLLAHAKLASALLSFVLFAIQERWLAYLVNGVVDGLIGAIALLLRPQAICRFDKAAQNRS